MENRFEKHLESSTRLGHAGSQLILNLLETQTPQSFFPGRKDFEFDFEPLFELTRSFSDLQPKQKNMIFSILSDLRIDHLKMQQYFENKSKTDVLQEVLDLCDSANESWFSPSEIQISPEKVADVSTLIQGVGVLAIIISDEEIYKKLLDEPHNDEYAESFIVPADWESESALDGKCFIILDPSLDSTKHPQAIQDKLKENFYYQYFQFLYDNYLKRYELPVHQTSDFLQSTAESIWDLVAELISPEKPTTSYFKDAELQDLFSDFRSGLCAYAIAGEIQTNADSLDPSDDFESTMDEIFTKEKELFLNQWDALESLLNKCEEMEIDPKELLPHFLASQSFDEMRIKIQKVLDAHQQKYP